MKNSEITVYSEAELPKAADKLLQHTSGAKVFAFYGEMGTGKTTFIKEICRQLGAQNNFSSPTYSLVNEYPIEGSSEKIFHIDLYRIKDLREALDAGIEDYINSGMYCFIEWAEIAAHLLPENTVRVMMRTENSARIISIFSGGSAANQ